MKQTCILLGFIFFSILSPLKAEDDKGVIVGLNGIYWTLGDFTSDDSNKKLSGSIEDVQTAYIEYRFQNLGIGITELNVDLGKDQEEQNETFRYVESYLHLFFALQWIPLGTWDNDTDFSMGFSIGYSPISSVLASYLRKGEFELISQDTIQGSANMTALFFELFPHKVIGVRFSYFQITTDFPRQAIGESPRQEFDGSGRGWTLSLQVRF